MRHFGGDFFRNGMKVFERFSLYAEPFLFRFFVIGDYPFVKNFACAGEGGDRRRKGSARKRFGGGNLDSVEFENVDKLFFKPYIP